MEEQKKSRKPLLVGVIAAVVVLAALLALLLTQCVGGLGSDNTSGADTSASAQSYELYWNVDRNNFEIFEDDQGQAAGTTARKPAEDGFYHVVFAKDGEQIELRVKERRILNIIDAFDVMGLVFDENGDVIDVLRLDDLPLEKLAWQYYIQSFGGNAVKLNSSKDLNGMEEMIKTNENTKIYDMSGLSEFVGAPAKLQKFDRAMVIANELGEITHIFIYERDGIERTEVRFCKHCNEEVTWHNWLKKDSLPTTGGHYFLDNDINTSKQNTIMDDQKVCLDLNGHTVYSKSGARIYSTFYPASSLAVMDTTETPGKFIYEGQGCDQGAILWARYGNIDIYDITLDASKGTTHSGGLCLATEDKTVVVMHSGTMIGGKTVAVEGKGNPQMGATVKVYGNFTMESGLITGGTANSLGGNVFVGGNGTFTMNGGKITNGRVKGSNGGNVAVTGKSTFVMNGGSITGGRSYQNEKGQNGAGGNFYLNGTLKMNGGTISGGTSYDRNGKSISTDNRLNLFIVNGDLYMYGGTIKGYIYALDTNVKDNDPAVIYLSGSAKIKGAAQGLNLAWGNGVQFKVGKMRGSAEVYVNAAGKFTNKTVESNVKYFHSDVPGAQVVYYEECLALGRMQCICGAYVVGVKEGEGIVHKGECDGTLHFWGSWDAVAKNAFPTAGGYYYLTRSGNVSNTLYVDAEDIYLDLNGHSLTVTGTYRAFVFRTSESVYAPGKPEHNIVKREIEGSLVLSDSVGTGSIKMPEATGSQGMLFWNWLDTVTNPKLTIYGGTYDASKHNGGKNYGAVAMGKNATINMYGGTIIGNNASDRGSSVYLLAGSVLNMYNDATIMGGTTTSGHGGNIYGETGSTINMYGDSKVINGTSKTAGGGNIYTNGTLCLNDNASVIGGTSSAGQPYNPDVFAVNGQIFVNGNGHIGKIGLTSTANDKCRFVVADNAKIDQIYISTYGASATVKPVVEIVGTLGDNAMVVVHEYSGLFTAETVKENADNFASTDGQPVNFDETTKKLRFGGKYMCVCGAAVTESEMDNVSHKLGCDKTLYFWLPLGSAATPTSGNYYLTSSKDWGATLTFGSGWDNKGQTIRLDLNGFDVVKENGDRRMLQVWNDTTLWLTNSKETGGRVAGKGWANYAKVDGVNTPGKGGEHSAVLQVVGAGTVNILDGVTLEQIARPNDLLAQGGIMSTGSGVINMYGGKLIAAGVRDNGAAVAVTSATAQFNMYGGEIVGGSATSGSAIYLKTGSVTIKDATITGGNVSNGDGKGGTIYAEKGTLTLENATITGSNNSKRGGAVYLRGEVTATMTGGSITAVKSNSGITAGAALYVDQGADFTLNSGVITAEGITATFGTTVLVEARAEASSTTTFTMKGGKIVGGTANGYNGIGGSALLLVNNNTTDKVIVDMQGGEIVGGNAKNNAGAVYVRAGTVFKISGDAKITGNTGGNLFLADGVTIEVGTMGTEANVGVTLASVTGTFSKNTVAETTGFVSDNASYAVERNDSKLAIMTAGTGNGDGTVTPPTPPVPSTDTNFHCVCGMKYATSLTDTNYATKGECFGDCDGTIYEWKPWDVIEKQAWPSEGGYYYLTSSGELRNSLYIDTEDMVIDLNGQTITVIGTYRAFVFQTKDSVYAPNTDKHNIVYRNIEGSLTITDTVGTGTVKMPEATGAGAMLVWNWLDTVKNPQLTIYGGTLDGSKHNGGGRELGAVSLGKNAVINMFGGTIIGSKGTNKGGSVILTNGSVMNMSGNATITGGEVTAADGHGGNVFVEYNAQLNMSDNAQITGGTTTGQNSGNVYNNGTVTMKDNASITGSLPAGAGRNDLFNVNGSIVMSDNAHVGVLTMTASGANNTCYLTVEDSIKIDDLSMGIYNGGTQPVITINGNLNDDDAATTDVNEGAMIILRDDMNGVISSATVADNANNFATAAGYPVVFDTTNSVLVIDKSGPIKHCMCGASITGATHALGCDKVEYEWQPLNIDPTTNRYGITISESGNYYLPKNFDGTTCTIGVKAADANAEITVRLDLNGKNYIGTNFRALQFWNKATVWISNSKQTGGLVKAAGWNNAGEHSALIQTIGTPTINILDRVTLQQTVRTTNPLVKGGAVGLVNGATLNMYGGTIIGGNSTSGAAVYMYKGAKLVMDGTATIQGGSTSERGGAIYMERTDALEAQPSLVMNGNSAIIGGDSLGGTSNYHHGGAVYMGKYRYAQLNGNASITNGVAKNNGGNVNLDGEAKLELNGNASITGGKSSTNNATANNADVFSVNGTLVFNGGHIGYFSATNTVNQGNKIYVKGNVKFDSFSSSKVGGEVSPLTITGTLTLEEGIFVNMGKDYKIVDRGTMTDTEWLAMVVNKAAFKCPDTLQVTFENDGIYLRDKATVMHCLCGAKAGETHLGQCNGIDVPWTAWNVEEKGKMPDVAGNWYIESDGTINNSTYIKSDEVIIDLNGKTVTVGSSYHAFIYQYTGSEAKGTITGSVTITDSGENGTLKIATFTKNNAGILFRNSGDKVTNAKLTIYGGHLDASSFDSVNSVGAIDLGENAVITMYGGKISGNKNAATGSAVYLNKGATLNMSGNAQIIGGGITNANLGDQKNGGGAVMVNQAYLYMSDNAQIIGGTTETLEGGSVKVYGSVSELHMSGNASITGGKVGANRDQDQAVYSVNAKVYMNGGTISSITTLNTVDERATFELKGNVVIGSFQIGGMNGAKVSSINFTGAVTENARIHVNMSAGYCIVKRGSMTDVEWVAFEAIADNVFTCSSDTVVTYEADGIYLRPASDGTNPILYHCVCAVDTTPACNCTPVEGVHTAECATRQVVTHLGECDSFDKAWNAWDVTPNKMLPHINGYWYLLSDSSNMNADATIDDGDHIYLDLNGKTITSSGRRFYYYYNGGQKGLEMNGSLTITDSVGGGALKRVGSGGDQGALIWNWLNAVQNPVLNIYGGHLDASEYTSTKITAILLSENNDAVPNGVINMYGGQISGCKQATNANAIVLHKGVTMKMTGGTIVGGEATEYASTIWNDGSTLVIDGTNAPANAKPTVIGGKTKLGSAITSWGTNTITDAVIIGGEAEQGGVFYINGGSTTVTNSVVNGGIITSKNDQFGGTILYTVAGNVTFTNCQLNGGYKATENQGKIQRGGAIYIKRNTTVTLDDTDVIGAPVTNNGSVIYQEAGTVTVRNGSTLTPDATPAIYAATVSLYNGIFNLEDGTIYGGNLNSPQFSGTAILIEAGTFNMSGGTITGGSTPMVNGSKVDVHGANGTFNMSGGTITGDNDQVGGVLVRAGNNIKISGTAKVTGNAGHNIYLADGVAIELEALSNGANIGVTMADANDPITKTASAANQANAQYIFVDGTTNNVTFVSDSANALYQHLVMGN